MPHASCLGQKTNPETVQPTCHNEATPREVFDSTLGGGKGGQTSISTEEDKLLRREPEEPQIHVEKTTIHKRQNVK